VRVDLLEHAAHVLENEPTRCMQTESLYDRTRRETGASISMVRFVAALEERSDRFLVLRTATLLDTTGWNAAEVSTYRHALASVGAAATFIALAERPPDEAATPAGDGAGSILADVHEGVAAVLRVAPPGGPLHTAAAAAVQEMDLLRRYLRGG
jgi:hypothetical protein